MRASRCSFALAYIDNNNVPELIVSNSLDVPHAGGHGRIFTYKNGKYLALQKQKNYQSLKM